MPEPEKFERVPPATVISDSVKSFDDSLKVNVIVAVWPTPSELMSFLREMLGV